MLVGSDKADLCLCKSFWFWAANSAWMCGWRFWASIRFLRMWKVWFMMRTWYFKFVDISCWSWCISVRSLRSVSYSVVTSDTDSRSSKTGISIGPSVIWCCRGSGRIFFSTLSSFEASVSSCEPAFSTYIEVLKCEYIHRELINGHVRLLNMAFILMGA